MATRKQNKTQRSDAGQAESNFIETVINVRRVAKVIKGGRRFSFSALVVVGDGDGKLGISLGKGRDVSAAISKALRRARKNMFSISRYKTTVPFTILGKHGASSVLIRSASKGTGVIAGGAVRSVMEAVGIKDVLAKSLGSSNPHNVVKATIDALKRMRSAIHLAKLRGKTVKEIVGEANVTAA
jgi:small subunit ribosomal protein S5